MRKWFKKNYLKILGSVLVPVFLFMLEPKAITTANQSILTITFQIKNVSDNKQVFADYNLTTKVLFQNIFQTKVTPDVFESLKKDLRVNYAEMDTPVHAAVITTNDSFFTMDSNLEDRQWYLPKTKVPGAWDYSVGSSNVIVAIIDTGIHASHIELNDGRVMEGYDTVKNIPIVANSNSDDNGHGTAVAGVIGAIPNNFKGLSGIAWNVKLMPVKALNADGSGDLSAVAAGIVWATDHKANIINLSLGGPGYGSDATLSNAISYAYDHGTLIVAAAGNDTANHGVNLDSSPVYPVCGDNGKDMVLGVAATDVNDQKASFSNFGASCIDISAPGKKIITSAFLPSEPENNILIYGSGTSLATPIVTGIAALLKSQNNNLSNIDIRNIIERSADDIYPVNQTTCLGGSCNGFLGKGRINALNAIKPIPVASGSLIREVLTGNLYIILNNTKRQVSDFVFKNRGFDPNNIQSENTVNNLSNFPAGVPLPPSEGTLVKSPNNLQVYVIESELKRPLTYLVFTSRGYSFSNVKTVSEGEIAQYPMGEWYWPPDGTMVLIKNDPTVFVMDQKVVRPVTYYVFTQRKLSFTKVVRVTPDEFSHIPRPVDSYWLAPVDGTLVKSNIDPGIYVIENGTKRFLTYDVFVARNYKFSNVKVLPQAEMDVIAMGLPLLTP
ncbi:MAG: S8 family serine peptidase [Candidatus Doudnabacteria bacterium]|nr:S8 family serine peptidase [Candidatus Doudnabacteria bacterium]